jgi:hypothetical protein
MLHFMDARLAPTFLCQDFSRKKSRSLLMRETILTLAWVGALSVVQQSSCLKNLQVRTDLFT